MKAWAVIAALVAAGGAAAATVGQVGRDAVPQLDGLPDWAGGRPDVAACERHIRARLDTPTTYRRASVESVDGDPVTPEAFDKAAGIQPPAKRASRSRRTRDSLDNVLAEGDRLDEEMARLERARADGHDLRLRIMTIAYDADNLAGVPVRAERQCLFRLIDGRLDPAATLRERADRRGDANLDAALVVLGRDPVRRRRSPTECCL